MVFDESISDNVSLSRILDCFIEDEEQPNIIINFLIQHLSEIKDIIYYSEYSQRIFFLDFISKCSINDVNNLLRIMKLIDDIQSKRNIYLVWQINQSNISPKIKEIFKPYLKLVKPIKHPYHDRLKSPLIVPFDMLFNDIHNDINTIAFNINRIDDDKFNEISDSIENSLFKHRIYQKDFFLLLDCKKQFLLLRSLEKNKHIEDEDISFFKQIFNSPVDIEIKLYIFKYLNTIDAEIICKNPTVNDLVEKSINVSHLRLNIDIYGIDNYASEVIFTLLVRGKIDWLEEMMDNDKEIFEKYFNICDLLFRLKNEH